MPSQLVHPDTPPRSRVPASVKDAADTGSGDTSALDPAEPDVVAVDTPSIDSVLSPNFPALPGTPRRLLAWAGLALALCLLAGSVALAFTSGKPRIEETLVQRVEARLTEAGVTDLEVTAVGRDITLTGPQARKSEAFAAETEGVRSVTVDTTATETTPEPTAATATDSDDSQESTSDADSEVRLTTGADTIVLQGVVADEATRELVAQAAGSAFPVVKDRLEVGAKESDWSPQLLDAIGELSKVTNGSLIIAGDVLTLDGAVIDQVARTQISRTFSQAAPDMRLVNNLRVDPEAEPVVPLTDEQAAAAAAIAAPQRQIDALLKRANAGPPMFATDSPQLSPAGTAVVNDIAEVLSVAFADAPTAQAAIGGHTDSTGSATYNQGLSEQRASSVLGRLISQGIQGRRLSATGFGPDEPVADNSTAAGRAQNRRITIDLLLPEPD